MPQLASPGDLLEELCLKATTEIVLVAPFIKVAVLERLSKFLEPTVSLLCVTRWRPDEIAVGVSDIEIWPLLRDRPNSTLWLRPDLHAKFYRANEKCLVGSANLTAAALGWSSQPNLELLIPVSQSTPQLVEFENELLPSCVQVDERLYQHMADVVEKFKEEQPPRPISIDEPIPTLADSAPSQEHFASTSAEAWIPTLRSPEKLYLAYSGRLDDLTEASRLTALRDLQSLTVPPGLSEEMFKEYVGTILLQKSIIYTVDRFVEKPQRFGAVRDLLTTLPCAMSQDFDANGAWQTLMRWLLYYLPNRYTRNTPRHSEIFSRNSI